MIGTPRIVGPEQAGPRIEDLHRLRAGLNLQAQVVGHLSRQHFEQALHRRRLAIEHRLRRAEAFLAFALHQVCSQREWRAAETNDRRAPVELTPQQAKRVGDEGHHFSGGTWRERLHLRPRADRVRQLRSRVEGHPAAQRLEWQEDV
jgi:hypothetical protein